MTRRQKLILGSAIIPIVLFMSFYFSYSELSRFNLIDTFNFTHETNESKNKFLDAIETRTARVSDIELAYKIFGRGTPLLLIGGSGGSMNFWNPGLLEELSSKHTVIVFDNRGMGGSTSGTRDFSIPQFAEDAAGLLDTLNINKISVLGYSMGGMTAQELTLRHPDKVEKLIIGGSSCGVLGVHPSKPSSNETIRKGLEKLLSDSNVASLLYPEDWRKQNQDGLENQPSFRITNTESLRRNIQAIETWQGVCDQLKKINQPTLVLTGTRDDVMSPDNSLILAGLIPGAWLVQIKDGGHGLFYQYPERVSEIIITFLKDSVKQVAS